jgi:hypothetical protein
VIDLKQNKIQAVCYGLVGYILRRSYPQAFAQLNNHMLSNEEVEVSYDKEKLPVPLHYVAYDEHLKNHPTSSTNWQRIINPESLQCGDIIAHTSANPRPCRGQHVAIVLAAEKDLTNPAFINVRVLDATRFPHGKEDQRGKGTGTGTICLKIDENNTPYGLKWSKESKRLLVCNIALLRPLH